MIIKINVYSNILDWKGIFMSKTELEEFKDLLLEERKEIMDNLMSDDETLNDLNNKDEGDLADQAYAHYEKNLVLGISKTEQQTLKKIDEALKRIEKGMYGVCETCGKPIEKGRLEVIPYTTLCIEHAKQTAKKRIR